MSNMLRTLFFYVTCFTFAACLCDGKIAAEETTGKEAAPTAAQVNWQKKVIAPMQTAQTLLQEPAKATTASAAQAEAIAGLDMMIADLTKRQSRCKRGPCKGSQCKGSSCKKGQCNKPGATKAGSKPGQTSNAGATEVKTQAIAAGDLVKDLWGKLPERQRQQILQPLNEKFLPKYANDIEAYFRTLANPHHSSGTPQ